MFNFLDGSRFPVKDTGLGIEFSKYKVGAQISKMDVDCLEKVASMDFNAEVFRDPEGFVIFGYCKGTINPEIFAVIVKKNDKGEYIRGTRADEIYKRVVCYKKLLTS